MEPSLKLRYEIDGEDFTSAGEASADVKRTLRRIGASPELIRHVSIAMYEGEINMVIHADGGVAEVEVFPTEVKIVLRDQGPGIENIELAMKEGYSTASDDVRNLGFGAGMGLPNMKKYTDEMTVESVLGKGTTITMRVSANP